MLFRGIMILLLAVLGAGLLNLGLAPASEPDATAAPEVQAGMMDAEALLTHHIEAFIDRDLDAVMSDYSEATIFITPDGVTAGLEEIRALYTDIFTDADQDVAPFVVSKAHSAGSLAYILWEWTFADGIVLSGSDTFVIEHGKIKQQSVAYFAQEPAAPEYTDDQAGDPVEES